MSSTMRKVVLAAGLMLVGTASTARAAGTSTIFEGNVPVPFVIHGLTFPAGRYTVERESSSILLIRGEKHNHAMAFIATQPEAGPDPAGNSPVLVLKQIEGKYELTSVWEAPGEGWDVKEVR